MSAIDNSLWPAPGASVEEWIAWANEWRSVKALNMVCTQLDERTVTFRVEELPFPPNPNGSMNGGMLSAVVDQVFGVLAMWASPEFIPATANLSTEYHRPLIGPATIVGEILPGGRRLQFLEAICFDEQGRRCVTGRGTMVAMGERPGS